MDAAIVSIHDLKRIQSSTQSNVRSSNTHDAQPTDSRREHLRELSRARASKWGNTLEAQRLKKIADRKAELARKEQEALLQDEMERTYKAEKRRTQLAEAEEYLRSQTDSMKAFRSVQILSDVQIENEKMIREKKEKMESEKKLQEHYHTLKMDKVRQGERDERRKAERMQVTAQQVALDQKTQRERFQQRLKQHQAEEAAEGERLKQQALDDLEVARKAREEKAVHIKKMRQEQKDLLQRQIAAKSKRLAEDQLIDDKIKACAEKKERMERERKEKKAKAFAAKRAIQQRMIDEQCAHLAKLKTRNSELLNRDQMQAAAKFEAAEQQKADNKAKLLAECMESQNATRRRKQAEREQEIKLEREAVEKLEKEIAALELKDQIKAKARKARLKEEQRFQKRQIFEKRKLKREQRLEMLEAEQQLLAQQQIEEADFQKRAHAIMDDYSSRGLSRKQMEKHLKNRRLA